MLKAALYRAVLLFSIFAFLTAGLDAKEKKDKDKEEGEKKTEAATQDDAVINPMQRERYVQPYPPSKFSYKLHGRSFVYNCKWKQETILAGRTTNLGEAEDLLISAWFKTGSIPLPTGAKYGVGTLIEEVKRLKKNAAANSENIQRMEAMIGILAKKEKRKVDVFDGFRYRIRRPERYLIVRNGRATDATQKLYESAYMGYSHLMAAGQIDEMGQITADGANEYNKHFGPSGNPLIDIWQSYFNPFWNMEEFPLLPPDIEYVAQSRSFNTEQIQADWEITYKSAKSRKDPSPVNAFAQRWGFNLPSPFPDWKAASGYAKHVDKYIGDADKQFRDWYKSEFKTKIQNAEDCFGKAGNSHTESAGIMLREDGKVVIQHNRCSYMGRKSVDVEIDGKTEKYNTHHWRRTVTHENPMHILNPKEWKDDFWYDASQKMIVQRDFELSYDRTDLVQQGQAAQAVQRTQKYAFNLKLIEAPAGGQNTREQFEEMMKIVEALNNAEGPDFLEVKTRAEDFEKKFLADGKDNTFKKPVEIIKKQTGGIGGFFTVNKGFKQFDGLFPEVSFCTLVPENFDPAKKYGLIVFLRCTGMKVEEEIKRWGEVVGDKDYVVVGYQPQLGAWGHAFGQTNTYLSMIVAGLTKTYNIDKSRRYLVGVACGAQMAVTYAAYTLKSKDRFSLHILATNGKLPFAPEVAQLVGNDQIRDAMLSASYLLVGPKNYDPRATLQLANGDAPINMQVPDSIEHLKQKLDEQRNLNSQNTDFMAVAKHSGNGIYDKSVAEFIFNEVIPRFEKDKKSFYATAE